MRKLLTLAVIALGAVACTPEYATRCVTDGDQTTCWEYRQDQWPSVWVVTRCDKDSTKVGTYNYTSRLPNQ